MSFTLKNVLLLGPKKMWNNKIQCNMFSFEVIWKLQLGLRLFYVITTNIQPGKLHWSFSPDWKNPIYSTRKLLLWNFLEKPTQKYALWNDKNKKQKKQGNIFSRSFLNNALNFPKKSTTWLISNTTDYTLMLENFTAWTLCGFVVKI